MPDPYTGTGWTAPGTGDQGGYPVGSNLFSPTNMQIPGAPNQNMGGNTGAIPNPGGWSNPAGSGELQNNVTVQNLQSGALKNTLAPQWANAMNQYAGGAGNFFQQLMNLGSPYYKQQQAAAFNQGVGQNQDAMAQAQQQLRQQGYGYQPSGANAAMIGGMNQQGSQNLAEQYLQNLFQNEAMQLQGAQGLQQNASLFNPTQLLGGISSGINYQKPQSGIQNAVGVMQGIGSLFGGARNAMPQ